MAPNVLLIITDQQRPDTLGFNGLTPCRTPNIDSIAGTGVSFNNAITPCPLCLPSRAAMFSGLYPVQNDMMDNTASSLTECSLLTHFRQHGYQVNYAGKWHLGTENIARFTDQHAGDSTDTYSQWCLEQGLTDGWMFNDPKTRTKRTPSMSTPATFVQHLPVDKTNEAYITDLAIEMIRSRRSDVPFFQICSYNGPHPPFMIPEPYYSLYDPKRVIEPRNFGPQIDEHAGNRQSYYRQLFVDHGTDFEAWRESYAVYWGFVTMIDDMVGKLLATLNDEQLSNDTLVVFVSDHGENLGAHGLWHKMVAYNESIRVPMIFSLPNHEDCIRGISIETPASLIDLTPTLASLCGLPAVNNAQGTNLAGAVRGEESDAEDRALFAMHQPLGDWMGTTDWRMVQYNGFKYIWHRDGTDELFDQTTDFDERYNLSQQQSHSNRVKSFQFMLWEFMQEISDPLFATWPFPCTVSNFDGDA